MNSLSIEEIGYFIEGNLTALAFSLAVLIVVMIITSWIKAGEGKEKAKRVLLLIISVSVIFLLLFYFGLLEEIAVLSEIAGTLWQASFLAIIISFLLLIALKVVVRVPAGKVWVVDRLGEFIKKEGLCLVIPIIDRKVKELVKEKREMGVKLWTYTDEESKKRIIINMKDNAQLILKNPMAFFQVNDIVKAMNKAEDFEESFVSLIDDRLSGHFANLTEKDIPKERKKDLASEIKKRDEEEDGKLEKLEEKTGVTLERITVDDFDYTEQIEKKRKEKYESEQDIEIAQNKAEAMKAESEGERKKDYDKMRAVDDLAKLLRKYDKVKNPWEAAMKLKKANLADIKEININGLEGDSLVSLIAKIKLGLQMIDEETDVQNNNEAGFNTGKKEEKKEEKDKDTDDEAWYDRETGKKAPFSFPT